MRVAAARARPGLIVLIIILILVAGAGAAWLALEWARSRTPKVVLIGIDGGEWRVIRPLIKKGELPNLARLVAEGASGNLSSYGRTMSPQVWNTIVTGKHYKQHGIDWFVVRLDDPGDHADLEGDTPFIPITSRQRKVPTVWDVLGQAGRTTGVIGFWATWPATPVNGYMVSDRFAYSRVNKIAAADQDLRYQTHPPELAEELRSLVMTPDQVTPADRARFISGEVEGGDWRESHNAIAEFDITYAQTQTYRRVGLHLLDQGQPDFWAIYFQGVDVTSHYFWEYRRPQQAGRAVPQEDVAAFSRVIEEFYKYQDAIIGEILERLDERTIVIIASDHGFRDLPYQQRGLPAISGWHRLDGILAIWGPGVRAGVTLDDIDVYDLTPTILALMKRPLAKDMPGRVLQEAFEPEFFRELTEVASYTQMPEAPPISDEELRSTLDEDILDRLRSIGYIEGAQAGSPRQ
jgi:predicted AlkP superfamily phosphohydrolase/phosphomutase